MPRPRVILSLLFVLIVLALGLRPAVLHLGSARHHTRPVPLPTQTHDAVDAYSTGR